LSLGGEEAWLPRTFGRENPGAGWVGLSFANLQQQGNVVLATNTRSPISFKSRSIAPETDLIVVAHRDRTSVDLLKELMFRAEAGKLPEETREMLTEVQSTLSGNPAPHTLVGLVESLDASACLLARNFLFVRLVQIREQQLESAMGGARCDHHYFVRPLAEDYRIVAFYVFYRDLETLAPLSDEPPVVENDRGESFLLELESVMEEVLASVKEDS
jgi:hypothetical protein